MKHKTLMLTDELWERIETAMAENKIFNSSEFIRLALEATLDRMDKKKLTPEKVITLPNE